MRNSRQPPSRPCPDTTGRIHPDTRNPGPRRHAALVARPLHRVQPGHSPTGGREGGCAGHCHGAFGTPPAPVADLCGGSGRDGRPCGEVAPARGEVRGKARGHATETRSDFAVTFRQMPSGERGLTPLQCSCGPSPRFACRVDFPEPPAQTPGFSRSPSACGRGPARSAAPGGASSRPGQVPPGAPLPARPPHGGPLTVCDQAGTLPGTTAHFEATVNRNSGAIPGRSRHCDHTVCGAEVRN
ncbi:hypothetical protein HNQ79_003439 [Streptomyces candidus]|uniref:Uncharacterized protein n=1 Tax=Streptomyces candidus TaxID=67283 RepID=A0A7X0LQZ6_9ACTN|nr:hypothetical protein [Streptomyces candidus]